MIRSRMCVPLLLLLAVHAWHGVVADRALLQKEPSTRQRSSIHRLEALIQAQADELADLKKELQRLLAIPGTSQDTVAATPSAPLATHASSPISSAVAPMVGGSVSSDTIRRDILALAKADTPPSTPNYEPSGPGAGTRVPEPNWEVSEADIRVMELLPGSPKRIFQRANNRSFFKDPAATTYDDDYVSVGKTQGCMADMMDADALYACLAKRHYKRELILVVANPKEPCSDNSRINQMLVNRILNYKELGWEHWLVLSIDEQGCHELEKMVPGAGCLWTTFMEHPDVRSNNGFSLGGTSHMWAFRWLLMTRLVQANYNLLMMDLDVEVTQNAYHYLKHPAFAKHNFFSMMESGEKVVTFPSINGGCHYVQNAHPDGPIAWIGASILDHTARWMEVNFMNPNRPTERPGTFEQSMVRDSICSAQMGIPVFPTSFFSDDDTWFSRHEHLCSTAPNAPGYNYEVIEVPEGEDWSHTLRLFHIFSEDLREGLQKPAGDPFVIRYVKLMLPSVKGEWPEEFGGYPFPGPRQAPSQLVRKTLADGGYPVFPAEDDEDPDNIRGTRLSDTWVAMPYSVFSTYGQGGSAGWGTSGHYDESFPNPIFTHTYAFGQVSPYGKEYVMKLNGWWHFEVHKILCPKRLFHSSTPSALLPKTIGYPRGFKLRTRTEYETRAFYYNLAYIAAAARRKPVWPELDCDSPWIRRDEEAFSGIMQHRVHPVGPKGDVHCFNLRMANTNNLIHSVSEPDFLYMLSMSDEQEATPSASNTIDFALWEPGAQVWDVESNGGAGTTPGMSVDSFEAAAKGFEDKQVVYLAKLFRLTDVPDTIAAASKKITGNQSWDDTESWDADRREEFESQN